MFGARRQDLEHPSGAGADIEQLARLARGHEVEERPLDLALIDIERADLSPLRGIGAEIGRGRFGARPLDLIEPLSIQRDDRIVVRDEPGEETRQRARSRAPGEPIENPAAFTQTVQQPGIAQQLQVTRYPGLALPEDCGELADGELAAPAKGKNRQPLRFGRGPHSLPYALHRRMPKSDRGTISMSISKSHLPS